MTSSGERPLAVRSLCDSGTLLAIALLWLVGASCADAATPCTPALGRVVSVQGKVELRRGSGPWVAVERDTALCSGDSVRVREYSRAALLLSNETTLRLDQGTTLTLAPPDAGRATLLEQLTGRLHVMTRTPRAFSVKTPFVNANVNGTEFAVTVNGDDATVAVFEGEVLASNDAGSATLGSGQQVTVGRGMQEAPKAIAIEPGYRSVAWALYFPAVFDYRLQRLETSPDARVRESVARYRQGRVSDALEALGAQTPAGDSVALLGYRAGLLLLVGRVDEATRAIEAILARDPASSDAHALQSVIAVVENARDRALDLARRAVAEDPRSAAALIALSYAQQARFELEPALDSVLAALALDPESALAHARRAELEMSVGRLDVALAAAQRAVQLDPYLARTQSVLGFANLTRIDIAAARAAFERAIELDEADPLPRLGLALATVREGDLSTGRAELEIAAILDPGNSLVRSYLGKAYYEEKRDPAAATQFAQAIERDPRDPTPYFYRAVMEQADNQPVAAVRDIERSIELNDDRAVFRSRLFLDQDLAARSVRLAYTYRDLGFDQLAELEAVRSLSLDPTEPSAHRFLADAYAGQIRTEAARVSELLQSQLRQPLGMNALQPQLFRGQQFIVEGLGPAQIGGYEFTPLFTRNGVAVKLDVIGGSGSTFGDQFVLSGLQDALAYSLGQFHFQTEGLRANSDSTRDVFTGFVQVGLSPSIRLQAELRDDFAKQGDISLRFDPENFLPRFREDTQLRTARLGGYFAIDPRSDLVFSAIAGSGSDRQYLKGDPSWFNDTRERLQSVEAQYAYRGAAVQVLAGLSYYRNEATLEDAFLGTSDQDTKETSAYAMFNLTGLPWGMVPQLGLSYDTYDAPGRRISALDPKLGLVWSLPTGTTLRAAAFRTIKRSFVANQTLQPTQIAGFNQFYDDVIGTRSSRVGLAIDQRFSSDTFAGAEASARNLDIPGFPGDPDFRWSERSARLYAYQIFSDKVTGTAALQYERFTRPEQFTLNEGFTNLRTVFVPLGLRLQSLGNWSAALTATGVRQQLRYEDLNFDLVDGKSSFVVVDASVAYRLPDRLGLFSFEVKNLFDKQFRYQEIDFFASPRVFPGRLFFARLSFAL